MRFALCCVAFSMLAAGCGKKEVQTVAETPLRIHVERKSRQQASPELREIDSQRREVQRAEGGSSQPVIIPSSVEQPQSKDTAELQRLYASYVQPPQVLAPRRNGGKPGSGTANDP